MITTQYYYRSNHNIIIVPSIIHVLQALSRMKTKTKNSNRYVFVVSVIKSEIHEANVIELTLVSNFRS